jgi:Domain of unknown function (DUF4440)
MLILLVLAYPSFSQSAKVKDEVWKLEEQYWKYVQAQDLTNYRTLWHDDFLGYPSNNIITGKDHITDWIADLYKDKNKTFSIELVRKVENVFDDIVIVLYDVNYTWRNENMVVIEKTFNKITHTWKKTGQGWVIIGGMGALIRKETVQ